MADNGIHVRRMVRDDCPAVLSLIKELSSFKQSDSSDPNFTLKLRDLQDAGFDGEPVIFSGYVAEVESEDASGSSKKKGLEVVGVALIHFKYSTWEGPVLHLNTLVVAPEKRRKGIGRCLMKALAKMAVEKKSSRISLEVNRGNAGALEFFLSLGALNLTKEEGWLNYSFSSQVAQKLAKDPPKVAGVTVRPTVPKDCERIHEMIQELAEFEKMPDGPKLTPKDHQRNGFFKLHPDFYSFVAEQNKEIIGFTIFFLTFDPLLGKKVHLEDLYVTPKERTKGVGEMLFKAVTKFVVEGNYHGFTLEVLDWNSKAIEFYDKFDGTNETSGTGICRELQSLRFRMDAISSLAT